MDETVEVVEPELINEEEEVELKANDDGTLEEVIPDYYDKRTGNKVMHPSYRSKNQDNNRREKCWNLYLKTVRDGNPSAMWAAKEAGFSPNTAINICKMAWFKEKKDKLRRSKMMNNAERNIARIINMGYTEMKRLEDGTEKEVVDKDVLKVVADMSKMIVTTLGKDLGYSSKTEVKVETLPMPILQLDAIDVVPLIDEPNETEKE